MRSRFLPTILILGSLLFLAGNVGSNAYAAELQKVPESAVEVKLSYAPLVKKAAPAVVNIFTKKKINPKVRKNLFNDPFFEQFFGKGFGGQKKQKTTQSALGSGVIIKPDGLIITNYHVVAGADEITVALNDRREFAAKVLLEDEQTDLAVLQINSGGEMLPFLTFHDSDKLEVGDLVLAIGNPFGVGQSVTSGIVSALGRAAGTQTDIKSFIQTDAAINPGNSGGALLTMNGTLAGINSAIFSKGGGSLGIGFAIPANLVQSVMHNGLKSGKVMRPWLGADGQSLSSDMAKSLGFERPTGVLISQIFEGGAADLAGLQSNDVVVSVDSHEITDAQALLFRISIGHLGETARVAVIRDGAEVMLSVPLTVAPEIPKRNILMLNGEQPMAGAKVGSLSPAFAIEFGLSPFVKGAVVTAVKRGSISARHKFRKGDIILKVNKTSVASGAELQEALNTAGDAWDITLIRKGRKATLKVGR
ncbi:MAG: Do family serine endopeptidase [Pseudomonas marincola]